MGKEANFLIYCMESYRHLKGISGAEVAELFEKYTVYEYVIKYFESLHTLGDNSIVQDIDDYISSVKETQNDTPNRTENRHSGILQ